MTKIAMTLLMRKHSLLIVTSQESKLNGRHICADKLEVGHSSSMKAGNLWDVDDLELETSSKYTSGESRQIEGDSTLSC